MRQHQAKYVRYGGQLYVRALEAPRKAPAPGDPAPPGAAPAKGAPAKDDPFQQKVDELQQEQTPEENVKKHLTGITGGVIQNAVDIINKAHLKTADADPMISGGSAAVPNNMELKFDLVVDNFSGMKTALYFNYSIKGSGAEGGASSFWDSVRSTAKLTGDRLLSVLGKSAFELKQCVFHGCGANYGAKRTGTIPDVPKLLEAVGLLQNPGTTKAAASRDTGKEIEGPKEGGGIEAKAKKLLKNVQAYINALRKKNPKIQANWGDKEFVKKQIKTINSADKNMIPDAELAELLAFVDKHQSLPEFMKELEQQAADEGASNKQEPIAGTSLTREDFLTATAAIVNTGKYTINFAGTSNVAQGAWQEAILRSNAQGDILVQLPSPMVPIFAFDTSGGKAVLKSASIEFCDKIFTVTGAPNASKLAWAGVVLALAKAQGINAPKLGFLAKEQYLTDAAKKALEEAAKEAPPEEAAKPEEKAPPTPESGGEVPLEKLLETIK